MLDKTPTISTRINMKGQNLLRKLSTIIVNVEQSPQITSFLLEKHLYTKLRECVIAMRLADYNTANTYDIINKSKAKS